MGILTSEEEFIFCLNVMYYTEFKIIKGMGWKVNFCLLSFTHPIRFPWRQELLLRFCIVVQGCGRCLPEPVCTQDWHTTALRRSLACCLFFQRTLLEHGRGHPLMYCLWLLLCHNKSIATETICPTNPRLWVFRPFTEKVHHLSQIACI